MADTILDYNLKINDELILYRSRSSKTLNDLCIHVQDLKFSDVANRQTLMLYIDFFEFDETKYKRILRNIFKAKLKAQKRLYNIGIDPSFIGCKIKDGTENQKILGALVHYDPKKEEQKVFIKGLKAIFLPTYKDTYSYIYDDTCDYLDDLFYKKNYCDFKNNKCGEKRNSKLECGCCRHYKNKFLGPMLVNNPLVICEYLDSQTKKCNAKCLPCKFYTCSYLEKKGVKFHIKDFLLLTSFLNPIQQLTVKRFQVYTPKDKIIKKLSWERCFGLF